MATFRVGDLVRLNERGFSHLRPSTREECRSALEGARITEISGPMTNDPGMEPLRNIELEGPLGAYLVLSNWIELVSPAPAQGGQVRYERWGSPEGREGFQRTLTRESAADMQFATEGIRLVDEHGNERTPTLEELNQMGVRRCIAAKDIHTGQLRVRDDDIDDPGLSAALATW